MDSSIRVDDLVVLGNAVPDIMRDSRVTVCTVGYSESHGLMRVYPVRPDSKMRRWDIVEAELERNPQDTRGESWKVKGSKQEWDRMAGKILHHGKLSQGRQKKLQRELQERFEAGCIQDLNDEKRSLGIIKPTVLGYRMEERESYDSTIQTNLFSAGPFKTIRNYKKQPRIKYECSDCKAKKPHDQQVLEWGIYEWMRKNPSQPERAWANLHLDDPGYEKRFLVGNLAKHRTSFVIVSVFRRKIGL